MCNPCNSLGRSTSLFKPIAPASDVPQVVNGAVHSAEMMNAPEAPDVKVYYARVAPFQLLSPPSD